MFLTKDTFSMDAAQAQLISGLVDFSTRRQDPLRPHVPTLTGREIAERVAKVLAPLVQKRREEDLEVRVSGFELKQLLDQLRQQEEARRRGENGNSFADAPAASPKAPLPAAPAASPKAPLPAAPVAKAPTVARAAKAPPVAETARQAAPPTDRRAALAKAAAAEMQTAFARANAKPVEKRLHVLVAR